MGWDEEAFWLQKGLVCCAEAQQGILNTMIVSGVGIWIRTDTELRSISNSWGASMPPSPMRARVQETEDIHWIKGRKSRRIQRQILRVHKGVARSQREMEDHVEALFDQVQHAPLAHLDLTTEISASRTHRLLSRATQAH